MGALAGVPQQRYSEERIEEGLQALALHGSSTVASDLTGIPEATLRDWRRNRTERYAEIRAEVLPAIRKRTAAMFEDDMLLALDKAFDMLDGLDPSALSSAEKAKAVQQLAVASGVYADKAAAQRGLPSFTVEVATGEEILKRLRGQSPGYVVDTTAEEITDAEVVDTSASADQDSHAVRREPSNQRAEEPAG